MLSSPNFSNQRKRFWRLVLDEGLANVRKCAVMPRIVVTHYRYKRPPPKKKPRAVEVAATVVVVHAPKSPAADKRSKKRPVAKAQGADAPPSRPPLPTVVVATSQKRLKRLRAELEMAEPHEPSPEMEAFFAHNVRPGGPLPPKR
jgi:hypothetical protein